MYSGYLSTKSGQIIPLKYQHVYVDIKNQVAGYTISQKYSNDEKKPIETILRFPTPAGVSVYKCEAKLDNGIVISCKIKEKEKAKKEYNDAINKGNTAYYMQRESDDVLSMAIGNMAPSSSVEITIKYVLMLDNEEDYRKLRINFPLTIMPRYSPVNTSSSKHVAMNPPKTSSKPFVMTIEGDIIATDGITSLDSKTHKIKISKMEKTSLHFEIQDLDALDRDMILTLERETSKSHAFTQEFKGGILQNQLYKHCTIVNVVPDFGKLAPVNVNDVYYALVLDKSGSMTEPDMNICKYAAKQFVALMPLECEYDIYAFADSFEKFSATQTKKTTDPNVTKMAAAQWITNIHAYGGTEILPVLKDVYDRLKKSEKMGVIVILSDGGVTNEDEIFKLVRENPNVSIFSIGIGNNVSQGLIKGLANHGNGHAEFIGSGDTNIVQKVISQLKKSQDTLRKYQKDYTLEIETIGGMCVRVPEKLPILYDQTNNTIPIFSEYRPVRVVYTEKISETVSNVVKLIPTVIEDNEMTSTISDFTFHRIAGAKLIEHLQNTPVVAKRGSLIDDLKITDNKKNNDPHAEEIIQISTDLNILSKYTAFIGVNETKDKITGEMALREIPLQQSLNSYSKEEDELDLSEDGDGSAGYDSAGYVPTRTMIPSFHNFEGGKSRDKYDSDEREKCMEAEFDREHDESDSDMGFSLFDNDNDNDSDNDISSTNRSTNQESYKAENKEKYTVDNKKDDTNSNESKKKSLTIVYVVRVCLSGTYMQIDGDENSTSNKIGGTILTATSNGTFLKTILYKKGKIAKGFKFNVGDIIQLVAEKKSNLNTLYEIISVGSVDEPWTISVYEK